MFLSVRKFKMIGMLLNVVHSQVQKRQQKHITKELNGFHKVNLLAEAALFVSRVNGTPLFVRKCLKRWLAQGSSWAREPSTRDNFSPYNKYISQLNQQTALVPVLFVHLNRWRKGTNSPIEGAETPTHTMFHPCFLHSSN